MKMINVISGTKISPELRLMMDYALKDCTIKPITSKDDFNGLKNTRIVFALEVDETGFDLEVLGILAELYKSGNTVLSGCTAVILVHSSSELYTKSASQHVIFISNQLGCSFIGHSVVEAIKGYKNFSTWQKVTEKPLETICLENAKNLIGRLLDEKLSNYANKLLVLHASPRTTSNTLTLWNMVNMNLGELDIRVLNVENGTIQDCIGCSFKTCLHYSKQKSCFYGGVMVEEIYPAIEGSDTLLWICPNYNDSISANLMAVINRLTALYRKMSFYEKSVYSIIVSGNSGGDSVAKQLIGALNINKGFKLPPYFSLMAIANDPGSIFKVPDIEELSRNFAERILHNTKSRD